MIAAAQSTPRGGASHLHSRGSADRSGSSVFAKPSQAFEKMTAPRSAKQPKGLSRDAAKWWRDLVEEYEISDPGGLLLLETAMRAFDRMSEAKTILDRDGMTINDRFGQPKPHPATVVERDSRSGMLQSLARLNLDVEPLRDRPGRPGGSR